MVRPHPTTRRLRNRKCRCKSKCKRKGRRIASIMAAGTGAEGAGGVSNLLNTIEQALQSADSSDDPNKVIEDTVAKLLAGNGATGGTNGADSNGDAGGASAETGPAAGANRRLQTFSNRTASICNNSRRS